MRGPLGCAFFEPGGRGSSPSGRANVSRSIPDTWVTLCDDAELRAGSDIGSAVQETRSEFQQILFKYLLKSLVDLLPVSCKALVVPL